MLFSFIIVSLYPIVELFCFENALKAFATLIFFHILSARFYLNFARLSHIYSLHYLVTLPLVELLVIVGLRWGVNIANEIPTRSYYLRELLIKVLL